jgi:hypothetical protein
LLEAAQQRYHVYHINVTHSRRAISCGAGWKDLMGDNLVSVSDYTEIPDIIADIVNKTSPNTGETNPTETLRSETLRSEIEVL